MPRLTNRHYLKNHHRLRADRSSSDATFVLLTTTEQWDLFYYYLPHESRPDKELLQHRKDVTVLDSSLPQRAGRAWKRLQALSLDLAVYRVHAKSAPKPKKGAPYEVRVYSEVNPDLDADRIAKIILQAMKEQERDDH